MRKLIMVLILGLAALALVAVDRPLVFGCGIEPQTKAFRDLKHVLESVFAGSGRRVTLKSYPAERSLMLVNTGKLDGEVRMGGLSARYPNLLAVPEPLGKSEMFAYSLAGAAPIRQIADLRARRVLAARGYKLAEYLKRQNPWLELELVDDAPAAFRMLLVGRGDVVLALAEEGELASLRPGGDRIDRHEPALLAVEYYIYLNRRHAALVPRANANLKRFKRSHPDLF